MKTVTILLLIGMFQSCFTSNKKNAENNSIKSGDTISIIKSGSYNDSLKNYVTKNDFVLDHLLEFNTKEDLIKAYELKDDTVYGAWTESGEDFGNSLLYPKTKNEVELVWKEDNSNQLDYIRITGNETDWKTTDGITLGMTLEELEIINRKPFIFNGFSWDFEGSINWDEGYLSDKKINARLCYPGELSRLYPGLIGEQEIRSDSLLAKKAHLFVCEIILTK